MSLVLDGGSHPRITAISNQGMGGGLVLDVPAPPTIASIAAADFCQLVKYFVTNTDLAERDDPRIELLEWFRDLTYLTGYNEGGRRLGPPGH